MNTTLLCKKKKQGKKLPSKLSNSQEGHISQTIINFSIPHINQALKIQVHMVLTKHLLEATVNLGKMGNNLHAGLKDLLLLLLHHVICLMLHLVEYLMIHLVVCLMLHRIIHLIPLDLQDHTQCHLLVTHMLCIVVVALTKCLHMVHPSAAILFPISLLTVSRELSQPRVEPLKPEHLNLTGNEQRYSCINYGINNKPI